MGAARPRINANALADTKGTDFIHNHDKHEKSIFPTPLFYPFDICYVDMLSVHYAL
jgi:hypothetical protein